MTGLAAHKTSWGAAARHGVVRRADLGNTHTDDDLARARHGVRDFPGYDVIVTNPPYLTPRNWHPDPARRARMLEPWRRTTPGLDDRADLYLRFHRWAHLHLRAPHRDTPLAGGVALFLCADGWLDNTTGRPLRADFRVGASGRGLRGPAWTPSMACAAFFAWHCDFCYPGPVKSRRGILPMSRVHPGTATATQQQAYNRLLREFRRTLIRPDVIQACFQAGVPIDAAGRSGVTALMAATSAGRHDVVLSLLRLGANPNCRSRRGDVALHYAAERGMTGMRRCIRSLVAHGADVNAVDRHGMTPLMHAATHGHVANMRTLVACGAAVDRVNLNGCSAFRLAAISCKIHVMQWLLKYGVDVEARDRSGVTALLDVVRRRTYPMVVPELIASGADPMTADARGQTAMDGLDGRLRDPTAKKWAAILPHEDEAMRAALEDSLMTFWTAAQRESLLKSLGTKRATRLLPRCMAAQAVRETALDWQRPAARTLARRSP